MDRDEYGDMFHFRLGQCVRWAEYPQTRHYIGQRRWTQREVLAPVVEYRLKLSKGGDIGSFGTWIREADLEAWEEQE